MKKIHIINNVNGREFGGKFETQELANDWVSECTTKNKWGKPDRWLRETDGTHTKTREVETEEGNYTEYFFPVEYTVTVEDITAEVQAKEQERQDRLQEIDDLKKIISTIRDSDKPAWEKKLLIRLIRELK